ncbi:MAG: hypothetical protein QOH99_878 [Frankiaceae bacterium]|jgi:hypothetical protein|nr:hypothetical protein [Frankiaceae bacterium]
MDNSGEIRDFLGVEYYSRLERGALAGVSSLADNDDPTT